MSTPVVEQIAVALKTLLEGVTEANGYNVTVAQVIRPRRSAALPTITDKTVVLAQDDPAADEEGPEMAAQWIQPFTIDYHVVQSEEAATAVDTELNRGRADIEKALRADHTLETAHGSALAIDIRIGNPTYFHAPDDTFEGVRIVANVIYRTSEDDPYVNV